MNNLNVAVIRNGKVVSAEVLNNSEFKTININDLSEYLNSQRKELNLCEQSER